MNVTFMTADHGACSYFRMLWPAEAVADIPGLDISMTGELSTAISMTGEPSTATESHQPTRAPLREADVVVVQRPLHDKLVDALGSLRQRGAAIAVDLDDDFMALHPDHRAQKSLDGGTNPTHLMRACDLADIVTAPTQALLDRYARHGRGSLIGNYLPDWAVDVPNRRDGGTIGWSGVSADHPGDLEDIGGAVAALLRTRKARFMVIGPPDDVAERLRLNQPAWGSGMLSLRDYYAALGSIDVGIVPLAPTIFNAAKSPLKGIEWAAARVPFVASPTPEYEWLASEGIGIIARTPEEWERRLGELLADEALRARLAGTGHKLVVERFLLRQNAWRWAQAWEQAYKNRHASYRRSLRVMKRRLFDRRAADPC